MVQKKKNTTKVIKKRPSELEMQVLGILWNNGPSSVRQVLESMTDGKKRAYTTVLTILQVMEKKGLLTHTSKGNAHIYKPAASRDKIVKPIINRLVDNAFAGSSAGLVLSLLGQGKLSDDEIGELQEVLEKAVKDNK
jgi:BlaI family penicillinase repressor